MTIEEAKEIVNIKELVFDIEPTYFGDGSCHVSIANVLDDEVKAKEFIEALKLLCNQ